MSSLGSKCLYDIVKAIFNFTSLLNLRLNQIEAHFGSSPLSDHFMTYFASI
jgi:hypothetical protein